MKRELIIAGAGVTLALSKATAVAIATKVIHFDQLQDGTWRLTYHSGMIPDFSKISRLVLKPGALELEGLGIELKLERAIPVPKAGMLHFDETPKGTWKLLYSRDLIPDLAQVTALEMVRED